MAQPPGIQINQLMCCEVPGDEPIVKFINVLDPVKFAPGVTVTKECGIMKLEVNFAVFNVIFFQLLISKNILNSLQILR